MLGAGSLTEALRQAFDPYSPQWLWIQAGWIACLSLEPFLLSAVVRPGTSRKKGVIFSPLILLAVFCAGPWILDASHGIYDRTGQGLWAGLFLGVGFSPAFAAAGALGSSLFIPAKHGFRWAGKILAPLCLGAALGAWALPSLLYSLAGISTTMVLAGVLSGLAGLGAVFFQVFSVPEKVPEQSSWNEQTPCLRAAIFLGGYILAIQILWSMRFISPLVGGYLPALWLVPCMACLGLALGGLFDWCKPGGHPGSSLGPGLALLFFAAYSGGILLAGDSPAMLAALLMPLGALGTSGNMAAWFVLAALFVLGPFFCFGYYFSCLSAFFVNQDKKIMPLIAWGVLTGFLSFYRLFLPACGTVHSLRLAGMVAAATCLVLVWRPLRIPGRIFSLIGCAMVVACLFSPGPGVLWKHGAIGYGGINTAGLGKNQVQDTVNGIRRGLVWETETSRGFAGLDSRTGQSMMLNGVPRGQARQEEFSRGMLGLIGAILHPKAQSALVIGFSNGCTPGWLSFSHSIKSVDVACAKDRVQAAARWTPGIPGRIWENPKIQIQNQDALAAIHGAKKTYDIIICAPVSGSVSSMSRMYTPSYFQAALQKMNPNGLLVQHVRMDCWDARSMSILYGSLSETFGSIQTWMISPDDLALVCSEKPLVIDMVNLSTILEAEPYKSRLVKAWSVTGPEGLLAHFLASDRLAKTAAEKASARGWSNTRNLPALEGAFSRAWARPAGLKTQDIYNAGRANNAYRPRLMGYAPDWEKVDHNRLLAFFIREEKIPELEGLSPMNEQRQGSYNTLLDGNLHLYYSQQERYFRNSPYPADMFSSATVLADNGSPLALKQVHRLEPLWPAGAQTCLAWYYWKTGELKKSGDELAQSLVKLQNDPLAHPLEIRLALALATNLAKEGRVYAKRLYGLLKTPFAGNASEEARLQAVVYCAIAQDQSLAAEAIKAFEPYVPWNLEFLDNRLVCYAFIQDPLRANAAKDLEDFKYWSP